MIKRRKVLIVGGSKGIGASMVGQFSKMGDMVAFTYHTSEEEANIIKQETGALAYHCDVRNEEDVLQLAKQVEKLFHSLDVLIFNAGIAYTGLLETMDSATFENLMKVDVYGAFYTSKYFLPLLRNNNGNIIFISSMWGQVGASLEVAYSAAKGALISLTKALAKEVAPQCRVNCICPGVIQTDMMANYSDEVMLSLQEETPLQRIGRVEDVTKAAIFLSSDNASFITGHILSVNGGMVI